MATLNAITPAQLLRLIGLPDAPMLVDLSVDADFEADPLFIPGAFRYKHTAIADLAQTLTARRRATGAPPRVILACQKGGKLSQAACSWLRADAVDAHYLEGGNFAWRDQPGAPRLPARALPQPIDGATLWVTRHRPKIDRIACPWLIRRFVDPGARFLFVAPADVAGVAEKFGATPFDVEGVPFSHHGDRCSFDTMLQVFDLHLPALARLATVVRGADTNRHDLDPAAAGLLAISVGLSRQYRDDAEQLNAGMAIYDALYRWARDGQREGHDWQMGVAP